MKRTTAPNNQSNRYVDQTGSTPGTRLTAEDMNLKQEEICNLLEGFGITLDGGNDEQLKELFLDYLNQKVKTTDNVTHNAITANGHVECNSTLNVDGDSSCFGTMQSNGYFQMRTGVAYSTGSVAAGAFHLLPKGWYQADSTITSQSAAFSYGTSSIYYLSRSDSTVSLSVRGGFVYSDGTLYVSNVGGTPVTFTYKKF